MKSFRDRNPYAVGIVSVLMLGLITAFAFAVGLKGWFKETYEVQAVFSDAAGLRTGNDVRLAGVKVGAVSAVDVDRAHGQVIVTLKLDGGVELSDDATAEIALNTSWRYRAPHRLRSRRLASSTTWTRTTAPSRSATPAPAHRRLRRADPHRHRGRPGARHRLVAQRPRERPRRRAPRAAGGDLTTLIQSIDDVGRAISTRDAQLGQLIDRADTITGHPWPTATTPSAGPRRPEPGHPRPARPPPPGAWPRRSGGEGAEAPSPPWPRSSARTGSQLDNLLHQPPPDPWPSSTPSSTTSTGRSAWAGPGLQGPGHRRRPRPVAQHLRPNARPGERHPALRRPGDPRIACCDPLPDPAGLAARRGLLAAGLLDAARRRGATPTTSPRYFPRAVALYRAGPVRVLGLPAGTVTDIVTEAECRDRPTAAPRRASGSRCPSRRTSPCRPTTCGHASSRSR